MQLIHNWAVLNIHFLQDRLLVMHPIQKSFIAPDEDYESSVHFIIVPPGTLSLFLSLNSSSLCRNKIRHSRFGLWCYQWREKDSAELSQRWSRSEKRTIIFNANFIRVSCRACLIVVFDRAASISLEISLQRGYSLTLCLLIDLR